MPALRFRPSSGPSIGMELEFQLLDPCSLDLVDGILPLLEICTDTPLIKAEFTQATVEINSKTCSGIRELEADVASTVSLLKERCRSIGMTISGGGTHPFCRRLARITPLSRFLEMKKAGSYQARILKTYAFHVHLGVSSGEEAIRLMKGLRPYLPFFLALSASSPFWVGRDSGCACYRQRVLAAMKTYGIPPLFESWKDFSGFFRAVCRTGMYRSIEEIHWDIRPRPDMGTLEVRVMDMPATIDEAMAIASLLYTLSLCLRKETRKDSPLFKSFPYWLERENYFNASHRGLDAPFIENAKGDTRPMREAIADLVEILREKEEESGESGRMEGVEKLLDGDPGYVRQRKIFRESGSLREVSAALVMELEKDLALRL